MLAQELRSNAEATKAAVIKLVGWFIVPPMGILHLPALTPPVGGYFSLNSRTIVAVQPP